MGIRLVDLSQEIYQGMPVFPLHQPTHIWQNISHEESVKKIGFEFATNNILINEHGGTHTDATYEFDPNGKYINDMPLEYYYGPAICLDVSHVSPDGYITPRDLEQALQRSGEQIERGDIVLLYTGHWNRKFNTDEWLTRYCGLDYEGGKWLAERGVVNIGIDSPSVDNPVDMTYAGHLICREYGISNTENLINLDQVAGKRFLYIGLPLKIRKGTGSPIRAVALFMD